MFSDVAPAPVASALGAAPAVAQHLGRLIFLLRKHRIVAENGSFDRGVTRPERSTVDLCVLPPADRHLLPLHDCATRLGSWARGSSWFPRFPITRGYLYQKSTVFLFKLNVLPLFFNSR